MAWRNWIRQTYMAIGLVAAGSALAQNSAIQGVVTDPSGASVPDASITVINVATGVSSAAKTNERGFYSVPLLHPGT